MCGMINVFDEKYTAYRRDESRMEGDPESISFLETEEEAVEILRSCVRENIPVTVQGARTGICGAAVPAGGHVHTHNVSDSPEEVAVS